MTIGGFTKNFQRICFVAIVLTLGFLAEGAETNSTPSPKLEARSFKD